MSITFSGLATGLDTDSIELLRSDVELVKLAHGVWLQIDADAERLQFGDRLENDA